jgi:hypothetical protein
MLSLAIEAEIADFLAVHADRVDQTGRRRLVRHGHTPKRSIQTGIGPIEVRRPRVKDRGGDEADGRIRFTSAVLPAHLRRTKNILPKVEAFGKPGTVPPHTVLATPQQ